MYVHSIHCRYTMEGVGYAVKKKGARGAGDKNRSMHGIETMEQDQDQKSSKHILLYLKA